MDETTVADRFVKRDLAPTRLADRYEVQALLGAGGMGSVFLARDIELDELKPGNVMIADDGRVVVTDFGLAVPAHTSDAKIAGTLAYMAPEQFAGRPVDARADIYVLGAVLYRMATGERPFKPPPPERTSALNPCDRRAHLPAAIGAIVARSSRRSRSTCSNRRWRDRYRSIRSRRISRSDSSCARAIQSF